MNNVFFFFLLSYRKSRKTNGITFAQFFNFFEKTFILWEPLYKFHLSVLQTFFPGDFYKQILNRKLNIDSIKEYKETHNNNFPPVRHQCVDKILFILFDIPNPNVFNYDYQYYQSYKYRDFARNIIKKYKPDIINIKIQFRMNHLNNKTKYLVINNIDKMYISFNTYGMKGMDMMITSPANSRKGSLNSNSSFNNYSFRNTSKGSILRGGSVKFSAGTAKLCNNNCGGLSPAHVSRMRTTSNCCGLSPIHASRINTTSSAFSPVYNGSGVGLSPGQYMLSLPTSPNTNNLYKKRELKECSIESKDPEETK